MESSLIDPDCICGGYETQSIKDQEQGRDMSLRVKKIKAWRGIPCRCVNPVEKNGFIFPTHSSHFKNR
jgi:hypothetical protein